jgi:hypothetical protein
MSAGTYNFVLEQGATFNRILTVQENGSAMDLTGYSVASKFRSTHDSSTVVGTFTCTISNASGGVITMEITSGAGTVTRLMEGQVTVNPEVTR